MVRSTQITIYTTGTDRPMVHSMALVRDLERRVDDGRLLAVRPRGAVHPSRLRRQRAGSGVLGFVLAVAAMVVAPTAAVACDPSVDPSCSDPYWTDPYAGDPYASDPYDSDPYYSDPYDSDPYMNDPYDSDPYMNDPYANDPYMDDPYMTDPYMDDPYANDPYMTDPYANDPSWTTSTTTRSAALVSATSTPSSGPWAYSRSDVVDDIAPTAPVPDESVDASSPGNDRSELHRAIAGRLVLGMDALAELGAFARDEDPGLNLIIADLARTIPSGGLDDAGYRRELAGLADELPALVDQLDREPSENLRWVLEDVEQHLADRLVDGETAFVDPLPWLDAVADLLMRGGAERTDESDESYLADDTAVFDFVALFADPELFDEVTTPSTTIAEPTATTTPDLALVDTDATTSDAGEDQAASSDEAGTPIGLFVAAGVAVLAMVGGLAVALARRRPGADGTTVEPSAPSAPAASRPAEVVTLPIAPPREEPGSLVELLDASRRMTASLDGAEIARIAVAEARNLVKAEGGILLRRTAEGITPMASAPSELFSADDLETSVLRRVVDTGRTISQVTSDDAALVEVPAAMAAVAIVADGSVIGALMVVRRPTRQFNPAELDALEMLAPLVGSALLAAQTHGSATALAELDALTGLANRRSLDRDITALRATHVASYVMIDVDHFKNFNDTNGHAAGDVALQSVAQAIAAHVRPEDRVYRYGGEEFCVLLPGASAAEAGLVAERVRAAVEEATIPGGENQPGGRVTISIGVADTGPGVSDIIERADGALYDAKERGRNQVCIAGSPAT